MATATSSEVVLTHWEQAKNGCDDALGELLELYRPYLIAVATARLDKRIRPKVAPSDVVQDTMLRAHHGFSDFSGTSDDDLKAWLRAILCNHLIDCRRAYKYTSKRSIDMERPLDEASSRYEPMQQTTPYDVVVNHDQRLRLQRCRESLPSRERDVVRWYHEDNLTFAQIGHRLECSAKTARSIWYRALSQLAQKLEQ